MDFFIHLLDSEFMPHGHCYEWRPDILWLHVISDSLITLAYATIPMTLFWFVKKRSDLAFKWAFLLFAAFILLCGATHALEVWSVWHGTYRLTGLVKALTGLVSIGTAGALVIMAPKALRLPSPQELEEANQNLLKETQERLRAEAELAKREREALFKAIVSAAPNALLLVKDDGRILLANRSISNMLGYDPQELIDFPIEQLVPSKFRHKHAGWVQDFFKNPNSRTMAPGRELFGVAKDGHEIPIEIGLSPLQWKGQNFVLASIIDIRERYHQKRLLQEAHQRFDRAVAGAMDGLWEWRIQQHSMWMSDQFFHILGYDPETTEASFDFWESRIHPDDHDAVMATLEDHLNHGKPYSTEHRLLCGDGKYRWVLSRGSSYLDPDGEREYLSGSLSIIQDRKDTERELTEKTTFLEIIYNGIQHGVFVIDVVDGEFFYSAFNPAEEELTQIPFEVANGKRPHDLAPTYFPESVAEEIRSNYQRCYDQKEQIKYTEMIPIKDRETWWFTHLTPLLNETGVVYRIIGSASEITSIKILENKIRAQEEFLRKIVEYSLNGLYIFNLQENRNTYINPAYTKITGYTLEDLQELDDLLPLFHPKDLPQVMEHLKDVSQLEMGESLKVEYRFLHKEGHWVWCYSNDAVFSTENGQIKEIIGTFIDITQIKKYGAKLEESNRELEQFAFVASHDLREPLRKVKAFADLLVSRFSADLPERATDYILRMANASARLDNMINDLLTFSRVSQTHVYESINLDQLLKNVVDDLQASIQETEANINVAALAPVEGDQNHLYQLFMNLISNALKYRREGIAPEIRIYSQINHKEEVIVVEDNGIGFPKENALDIFHIFKRLHGRSEFSGNGIGLAICKKIVDRHGGRIWAEPREDGPGARFFVHLPLTH